jgi:hypothetical protein
LAKRLAKRLDPWRLTHGNVKGVDFEESVRGIEAFSGQLVQVEVRGADKDRRLVADFSGELRRMGDVQPPPWFQDAVTEEAVTFIVGDGTFSLLPSRFVRGSRVRYRRGWLELRTHHATLWIGPKRPAWSD